MKSKKFRVISLVLAAVLLLGALAGCGKSGGSASDGSASGDGEPDDQLAAIQKAGKIVVGIEGNYPPYTYHDPKTNELVGLDVDLAKAIAEKLGVEVEFVEAPWDSLLIGIDSGRLDTVINAVTPTDERREKYDFSKSYYFVPRQIVVRGDETRINSIADLKGKTVACNTTNDIVPWLQEQGATVAAIDTGDEALQMLTSGRADFTVTGPVVLNSYLKEHPDANVKVAFNIPGMVEDAAIPIRKGETRLLEAVNGVIDELLADGTLAELSNKYVGGDYTKEIE